MLYTANSGELEYAEHVTFHLTSLYNVFIIIRPIEWALPIGAALRDALCPPVLLSRIPSI